MSKLEELIKEFCPNGVEYKKIKECYNRLKGTPITAGKMKEIESSVGNVTIFAGGKTVVVAKEQDIPNANIIRVPAVVVQSRGIIDVIYCNSPFTFKNEMWAYSSKEETSVKYLFYYLKSKIQLLRDSAAGMGALPQISLSATEELQIPLPALPVQREIVRILDSFTLYSAELTAELTARRKQYEFYRDKLLTFDDTISANVKKIELGNIADIAVGTKPEQVFEEKNLYEYINAGTTNSGYVDSYNCLGDTVTTPSRGQGGIGFVGYQRQNFWLGPLCYKIKSNTDEVLTKYIFHYLQNNTNLILSLKKEGGVPAVNRSDLVKIPLIYPPRAVQERIVKVLDNFDAICSDLGIGLPAEIEKRQKQYEYYRDKLLTF